MDAGPDRRRRRRPLLVEVQVRDQDEVYFHKARNVSTGGMFIDAPVPLAPGTHIQLQFRLPQGSTVRCGAEVRWNTTQLAPGVRARHPGMGVVFREVTDADLSLLRGYVDA